MYLALTKHWQPAAQAEPQEQDLTLAHLAVLRAPVLSYLHQASQPESIVRQSLAGALEQLQSWSRRSHLLASLYQQLQVLTYPWLRRLRRARAKNA
mmetsp:Transcript_39100/g.84161  ORF Transcript_39100/g.84161 Transcript_39100/m.84161 type:complete len:96 (+) Transcript_39100:639-926(+)